MISKGPEVKQVLVPNVLERTQEQAMSDLATKNLTGVVTGEVYDDRIEAGRVVSQYPDADTEVDEGTEVNIQISKGPDPSTVTPEEVTKTFTYNLPDTGETVNIQVMIDNEVVYNENWDTAMDLTATIPLTGSGTKMAYIYVNGVLAGSQEIVFSE